jgi:hypothetical protein
VDGDRVPEMVGAHNGDGPSAASNSTAVNGTGVSGGGSIDTPSGGSGDLRVDSGSSGSGDLTTGHEGSLDLGGNGRGGSSEPSSGHGDTPHGDVGPPERAPDGPPEVRHTEVVGPDHDLFHNGERRFADGLENQLSPNTRYDLVDANGDVATVVHTDANGRISYIRTSPGPDGTGNPELVNPRPNATYVIDDFTYKTDHLSRTVSVEGELSRGSRGRNDEQTLIGYDGQDYYRQANKDPEAAFANHPDRDAILEDFDGFADVRYNGSHIIGGGEYAGAGERINVIPLKESINQARRTTPTIADNFRRLELAWKYLIDGDWNRLMGIGRESTEWEGQVRDWRHMIESAPGDAKIYVKFDIEYDNDMSPVDYTRADHDEKNPRHTDRTINPPPTHVNVSWTLNGVKQEPVRYVNTPGTL